MKVKLPPVRCLEKTIVLDGEESDDSGYSRGLMELYFSPFAARMVLQLSCGGVESVANGNVRIFMRPMLARLMAFGQIIF